MLTSPLNQLFTCHATVTELSATGACMYCFGWRWVIIDHYMELCTPMRHWTTPCIIYSEVRCPSQYLSHLVHFCLPYNLRLHVESPHISSDSSCNYTCTCNPCLDSHNSTLVIILACLVIVNIACTFILCCFFVDHSLDLCNHSLN